MGTFTCEPSDDAPIHSMREDSITSPFLYIPSCPQHDGKLHPFVDVFVPPQYTGVPDATQATFRISSDDKGYYPALEATDVTMHQSRSPAISELGALTPGTTFSATSDETGLGESQCLIKSSTDSSAGSNTSYLSRKRIHRESKESSSKSRTSSCSTSRRYSSSQDITSRSSSRSRRKSPKHHIHKAGTYAQIHSPTLRKGDSALFHQKEYLVSLHRNSCRIFETGTSRPDQETGGGCHDSQHAPQMPNTLERSYTPPTRTSTFANRIMSLESNKPSFTASPSLAPLLTSTTALSSPNPPSISDGHNTPETQRHRPWDPVVIRRNSSTASDDDLQQDESRVYRPIPATVIDWTSPSTRRREYAEIDRSTRGVRGMWRKIAPSWCQPGGNRMMTFFEEGKGGKGMYEGSVRRFRMDVPSRDSNNNDDDGGDGGDETNDGHINGGPGGNGDDEKGRSRRSSFKVKWKWIESSISPPESVRGGGGGGGGGGKDVKERGSIIHGKWRCLSIIRKAA
ncbi:conserved hypothetical protein [Histoplasma capsulatum G186AR]|uniref:Uncharacterized protein n=1 Tax=Ajellomyces capsulatus (strain G186AR / H82 / ATCC MYA-2454 / RMSCC 2432) TaxID=447093 RepID=C0NM60_AJECG|nr:uncharacterized protein HCBG_04590 [Histoplasma capsulatum G186AR]EEH07711.1 conserved hypothetical protein [Histoplasma capsulatum G186AR]